MVNPRKKWTKRKSNRKRIRHRRKSTNKFRTSNRKRLRNRKKTTNKVRAQQRKHPCAYGHVFSTQCGHCINMQEDWDKLTEKVKNETTAIELIDISENHQEKVDELNRAFKTDLKFSGFPTIFKILKKNTPVHYYQGDRSKDDMKKWLFS